jgi:serine protease Do
MLSIADVQWVLDQTDPRGGEISAQVNRAGKELTLTVALDDGWRRAGDLSWRASSWGLRRMATGGMLLERLPQAERARLNIADGSMALRVKHVGQYGPHAAAKKAGFRQGDVIIEFDGRRDLLRDTDVLRYGVTKTKPGDRIRVRLLRDGKPLQLTLPMQT